MPCMTHHQFIRSTIVTLIGGVLLLAAGCSTDPATSADTEVPPAAAAPTTAPATTAPATTAEAAAGDDNSSSTPEMIGSAKAGPFRSTSILPEPGGIELDFPVDGLFPIDLPGLLLIASDPSGSQTYVSVFDAARTSVFDKPIDATQFSDPSYMGQQSSPMPDDFLTWFSAQPGIAAGPIETVDLNGNTARRLAVTFEPFDGGLPCMPGDERVCHFFLLRPEVRAAYTQFVGDEAAIYDVAIDDKHLIVVVDLSVEPELANQLVESLKVSM